jgi:hypothetical protein
MVSLLHAGVKLAVGGRAFSSGPDLHALPLHLSSHDLGCLPRRMNFSTAPSSLSFHKPFPPIFQPLRSTQSAASHLNLITPPPDRSEFHLTSPTQELLEYTKTSVCTPLHTVTMNGASTASSFWAQKSREVKSSVSPRPVVAEPPKLNGAAGQTKPRIVLKGNKPAAQRATTTDHAAGMTNGASATSTPKKPNWADSDEDDDFIASFPTKKETRLATLEAELADKTARTESLEGVVSTKDARIAQLEDVVKEKDHRILDLEAVVDAKNADIEKLKADNHAQFLYVQELVAEVDEKSRCIRDLETELDIKGARNCELEEGLESVTQVSVGKAPEADTLAPVDFEKVGSISEDTVKATENVNKIQDDATPSDATSPEVAAPVAEAVVEAAVEPTPDDAPKQTPTEQLSSAPAIDDSKVLKMWSPNMLKKAAPVEKPKVLKMAIDMSKYSKRKPAPVAKKTEPAANKRFVTPAYGRSTKQRPKTDVVPNIQPDKDIRHMSHAERVLYANGPEVAVMLGTTKLATLPKYVMMQCSAKAYRYFTDHLDATSITYSAGSMDVDSAKAHLQWMDEMTYQGRVYSITLNGEENFDTKNLKICRAARVIGLNNTYVGHFTKVLCDRVRSANPSMALFSLICELATPGNDPIFDCLANNIVNQQLAKNSKKSEALEKLADEYPLLKEKMAKIEQGVRDSRAGDKRRAGMSREGSRSRNG